MTLRHRCLSPIVLALAVAALAVPIAQAGPGHPNLVGQTEAKGYAALSQAILNTSRLQSQRRREPDRGQGIRRALAGDPEHEPAAEPSRREPDRGQGIRRSVAGDPQHEQAEEPEPGQASGRAQGVWLGRCRDRRRRHSRPPAACGRAQRRCDPPRTQRSAEARLAIWGALPNESGLLAGSPLSSCGVRPGRRDETSGSARQLCASARQLEAVSSDLERRSGGRG